MNDWKEHYINMPEYNNKQQDEPLITATFKFRNEIDFANFNNLIKKYLYNNKKVFDGMQTKYKKSAWFPPSEKASNFIYES